MSSLSRAHGQANNYFHNSQSLESATSKPTFGDVHANSIYSVSPSNYYPSQQEQQQRALEQHPLYQYYIQKQESSSNLSPPSCQDLRALWRASIVELTNSLGFFVFPNDLTRVVTNPYYQSLIRASSSQAEDVVSSNIDSKKGSFGKIISYPSSSSEVSKEEVYGRMNEEPRDRTRDRSSSSYGHVILTPEEAGKELPVGSFGDVVETPVYVTPSTSFQQQDRPPASSPKVIVISASEAAAKGRKTSKGSSSRKTLPRSTGVSETQGPPRTNQERSKSSLTAEEFFNARWHDEPVKF